MTAGIARAETLQVKLNVRYNSDKVEHQKETARAQFLSIGIDDIGAFRVPVDGMPFIEFDDPRVIQHVKTFKYLIVHSMEIVPRETVSVPESDEDAGEA